MKEKEKLKKALKSISDLSNRSEVFQLIIEINEITKSINNDELYEIYCNNDLYIRVMWKSLHNDKFLTSLKAVLESDKDLLEEKEIIQLFLRLSFFMISILRPVLKENPETVFFLKRHFTNLLRDLYNKISTDFECGIYEFLSTLEEINYNRQYEYNENVNTDFKLLIANLKVARISFGILIISKIVYWSISELFRKVVQKGKHPGYLFKVTKIYKNRICDYTSSYFLKNKYFTKKEKKKVEQFILLLLDKNVKDFLILIGEVGLNPNNFEKSKEHKIDYATELKKRMQKKFETLEIFKDKERSRRVWSHKTFLNTIAFLSVLESIKNAKDKEWKIETFDYFLNQWLKKVNKNINYYDIEEFETIPVYVEGKTDKIILENAYDKLYPKHNIFDFYEVGGKRELYKKINAAKINDFEKKAIGIFDFDKAYNDFKGLRKENKNTDVSGFGEVKGEESKCLYRIRSDDINKIFAVLLPIPDFRKDIASRKFGENSLLSIEMLFRNKIIDECGNLKTKELPGKSSIRIFGGNKKSFAKKTSKFEKIEFEAFKPLFERLIELSNYEK